MSYRRISADPDMGRWIQQLMGQPHHDDGNNGKSSKGSGGPNSESTVRGSKDQSAKLDDPDESVEQPCIWRGVPVHVGVSHSEIREKYWNAVHERTYLQCYPEVYEHTACIHARSLSKLGGRVAKKVKRSTGAQFNDSLQRLVERHRQKRGAVSALQEASMTDMERGVGACKRCSVDKRRKARK